MSKVGRCIIFLWVDDLLIFSAKDHLQPLVDKILTTFERRDLKELSYVLGMEVIRDRFKRTITITHRKTITELLSHFHMSDCKRSPTPLVPKEKIMSPSEDPSPERATVPEHKRFMQAVGSIQYIAVVTRPDLEFAAHVLARREFIAEDTTEAELIAMSSTANELMWAKQLCTDFSLTAQKPTLWGDNKSANLLAVNPILDDRSKHIRVRHLRVREYVELDEMIVKWIGTKEMLADGFTKVLPGPALANLRDKLQLATI